MLRNLAQNRLQTTEALQKLQTCEVRHSRESGNPALRWENLDSRFRGNDGILLRLLFARSREQAVRRFASAPRISPRLGVSAVGSLRPYRITK